MVDGELASKERITPLHFATNCDRHHSQQVMPDLKYPEFYWPLGEA